jgi:hypothetical protein
MTRSRQCCGVRMEWSIWVVVVLLGACSGAMAQTVPQSAVHPTHVYVTLSDPHGGPVNLTASDLKVILGKQMIAVDSLEQVGNEKLSFALLVDMSSSGATESAATKRASSQLFQALASGGNQGYLVLFNQKVTMSGSPLAPAAAQKALNETRFDGGTALYDAINQTCTTVLSRRTDVSTHGALLLCFQMAMTIRVERPPPLLWKPLRGRESPFSLRSQPRPLTGEDKSWCS